jgi:hypothetical protein
MLKWFDFECPSCHERFDDFIEVKTGAPPEKTYRATCKHCGKRLKCMRVPSLFARYMGEVPHNPMVSGGNYDTTGHKKGPKLPDLPDNATGEEIRGFIKSKEYQEIKKERRAIGKENALKKKRAAAIRRGENVSMRRDRLPGDPDFRRS